MQDSTQAPALFQKLIQIVADLRDPKHGCPWDREQNHKTLKPYLIEESYEVLDAIDLNPEKIPDELGDVLLQVMLHSQIASEEKRFSVADVIKAVSDKMIQRHPHVFGDLSLSTSKEVLQNWEKLKQKERSPEHSALDGVPRGMPALLRAQRTGEKAARIGFEWRSVEEVRDKVAEELGEFLEVACDKNQDRAHAEEEFGDILFALTQLARRLDYNSEDLLQRATDKFTRRFKEMERRAGPNPEALGLEKLDAIWEEIKRDEKA